MEARIVKQDDDYCYIEWESDQGFGTLTIKHVAGTGDYIIDAEFMSISTVIAIFKALK